MARAAYPRPELVREDWTNLCGQWEFEFDFGRSGESADSRRKAALKETSVFHFSRKASFPTSHIETLSALADIGKC